MGSQTAEPLAFTTTTLNSTGPEQWEDRSTSPLHAGYASGLVASTRPSSGRQRPSSAQPPTTRTVSPHAVLPCFTLNSRREALAPPPAPPPEPSDDSGPQASQICAAQPGKSTVKCSPWANTEAAPPSLPSSSSPSSPPSPSSAAFAVAAEAVLAARRQRPVSDGPAATLYPETALGEALTTTTTSEAASARRRQAKTQRPEVSLSIHEKPAASSSCRCSAGSSRYSLRSLATHRRRRCFRGSLAASRQSMACL
mmetsp:Transcript_131447/g.327768  ORF Transcript_131447/g.327768 Transcript_131447/m.327768 type:complete len:254 (-) Transcript_131447:1823-2584(-)